MEKDSNCFSEKTETNIMSNNGKTDQTANKDNESLYHHCQNSELKQSDNVIPNNNQVESENMSSEMSVEAEMEKMCDSLTNELDNNVNTNDEKMCEDLQGILESDEHSATNTNSDFESAAKIPEVSNLPEPMEVDEEPPQKNISEPCPNEESQNQKNVDQCTEPILRNDEKQIENKETNVMPLASNNENIEKEISTSLTQETEHVNMIDLEQNYEKNEGKDTSIESNKSVNENNPLGDNLDNVMDNNLNKENEVSEKSNVEKNLNIGLNSEGIALATGDLTSSNNGKNDELNKNMADNSSVGTDLNLDPIQSENQEGADAELCIIPDTHREISQVC